MTSRCQTSNHLINQKGFRIGAIALALMAIVLPACANNQPEVTAPETTERRADQGPITQDEQNVTINEVNNNLEELIGQTVTVRSEAEVTEEPNSFLLTDDTLFGSEDVLVLNASGVPFLLPADQDIEVQVTGEVRQFMVNEVNEEFNLNLDPAQYAEYDQQPVIFAESMALAPEPGELTENPQAFYQQPIAVEGTVAEIRAPGIFTMHNEELFGGEDLLVLNVFPEKPVEEGETVTLVGELRPFVIADIEQDYDTNWDAEVIREVEAQYRQEPIFVVREVYPSAQ
jgi:hypothetical protein